MPTTPDGRPILERYLEQLRETRDALDDLPLDHPTRSWLTSVSRTARSLGTLLAIPTEASIDAFEAAVSADLDALPVLDAAAVDALLRKRASGNGEATA